MAILQIKCVDFFLNSRSADPHHWLIMADKAVEAAKEFQSEKGETPDTNKQFSEAAHQARNDYQDAGSPFGDLDNRDRSTKTDVPDKEE